MEEDSKRPGAEAVAAHAPPLLSAVGVSKTYGSRQVLRDACLSLQPGEIRALLGQNGSGKSTFIKVLAGYADPDPGAEVAILGESLSFPLRGQEAQRRGLAFVHQDLGLLESESVLDNYHLVGFDADERVHVRWARHRERVRESLAALGLDIPLDKLVGELSQMEQALVAIARAVTSLRSHSAGVLILDEPTTYLPRDGIDRLFAVMRQAAAAGFAILFVTHRLDEVAAVADSVTILRDGLLVANGQRVAGGASAALDEDALIEQILGYSLGDYYPEHAETAAAAADARPRALRASAVGGEQIRDLDLDVAAGEVVGVTGLLGMGWEEIPYLLFGARPGAGEIEVDGRRLSLAQLTPRAAMRAGIALLPGSRQRESGIGAVTLRENLTLPVLGEFWSSGFLRHRREAAVARESLERFGVQPADPERQLSDLSGGNQQKLLLAKWFQRRPAVFLMHEPTQGVDVGARKQIFAKIVEACETGMAVVIASSEYEDLAHLCDRVLVFRDGRKVSELSGASLTGERIAEQCLRDARAEGAAVMRPGTSPVAEPAS